MQKYIYFIYILLLECNTKCSGGCRGPDEGDCISCQPWRFPITENSDIVCAECERVEGYFTKTDPVTKVKECREICGDGRNLGEYDCDDGNLIGGDGCSSLCRVEEGFKCNGGTPNSPDLQRYCLSSISTKYSQI